MSFCCLPALPHQWHLSLCHHLQRKIIVLLLGLRVTRTDALKYFKDRIYYKNYTAYTTSLPVALIFKSNWNFWKKGWFLKERIMQLRQSCIINTEHKNLVYKAFYIPMISWVQLMTKCIRIGMWKLLYALGFHFLMYNNTRGLIFPFHFYNT